MTTIKKLTELEEILLKADAECRYSYTLDELIKSEAYMKEIGSITNIFFSSQIEYSKTLDKNSQDFESKLSEYRNFLSNGTIDVDDTKYINFIKVIKEKVKNKDTLNLMEKYGY
jgi:hypothetical protein